MITVVEYGSGNLASIQNMLKKVGVSSVLGSTPEDIESAERLLLPGVGAFDACAFRLRSSGLIPALQKAVLEKRKPVLGICVGMQLLLDKSEEGNESGLGWIPGRVERFKQAALPPGCKVPHMGWTEVDAATDCFLLQEMHDQPRFYFVHSYHAVPESEQHILMTAEYGYRFAAAIQKDNIVGVQFHPEKSHRFGMQLFKNFMDFQS